MTLYNTYESTMGTYFLRRCHKYFLGGTYSSVW